MQYNSSSQHKQLGLMRTVVLAELSSPQADHVLDTLHRPAVHVGGELLDWGREA